MRILTTSVCKKRTSAIIVFLCLFQHFFTPATHRLLILLQLPSYALVRCRCASVIGFVCKHNSFLGDTIIVPEILMRAEFVKSNRGWFWLLNVLPMSEWFLCAERTACKCKGCSLQPLLGDNSVYNHRNRSHWFIFLYILPSSWLQTIFRSWKYWRCEMLLFLFTTQLLILVRNIPLDVKQFALPYPCDFKCLALDILCRILHAEKWFI